MKLWLLVICAACISSYSLCAASKLLLQTTTDHVRGTVSLRCSVQRDTGTGAIVGKRDVTTADVAHVTSILVTRYDPASGTNVTVASMTPYGPATAHLDKGILQATGNLDVAPPSGEMAYLDLIWTNPRMDQYGPYTCEVAALNSGNHAVQLSRSDELTDSQPSVTELLMYITDLHRSNEEMRIEFNKTNEQLKAEIKQLTSDLNKETLQIQTLQQSMANLKGQNIQFGYVTVNGGRHTYQVLFQRPYKTVPSVFTAIHLIDHFDSFVEPSATNITTTGFILTCSSASAESVVWVAMDN